MDRTGAGRPPRNLPSQHVGLARVSGYIGKDYKKRVDNVVGFLGFTSISSFVAFAVEQAVERAEKDLANISEVYKVLSRRKKGGDDATEKETATDDRDQANAGEGDIRA